MGLIRADARFLPLVDGCVQTCVTSPPYFGLRDYGSAKWIGGDAACGHVADASKTKKFGNAEFNKNRPSREATKIEGYYFTDVCGKCGAQRVDPQIGLEPSPDAYVQSLLTVFAEVWRVLKDDGTVWLNLGDSYASQGGSKAPGQYHHNTGQGQNRQDAGQSARNGIEGFKTKDLLGIPWRVAFALQAAGWYLRSDIIWSKPNPMPESVTDRPTKAHEYIFLLSKQERYYYDAEAIAEKALLTGGGQIADAYTAGRNGALPGRKYSSASSTLTLKLSDTRNKRSVWHVATQPYSGSHFATFPEALIEPCILAGSRPGDLVLDPFIGSGTVGTVCERHGRKWVGTDLSYQHLAKKRTRQRGLRFSA
jgi:DNA modification methylase